MTQSGTQIRQQRYTTGYRMATRKSSSSGLTGAADHMEVTDEQEFSALNRKLQSKVEALTILRYELEKCRTERDQFKLMAETIQMRYSAIKNSLNSPDFQAAGFGNSSAVSLLVKQTRERNEALTTEVEALKQRLYDLEGDIKVVRARNVELQDMCGKLTALNETLLTESGNRAWQTEKSKLIVQMETLKKRNAQLQYDFRSLLDEKEEVTMERDAYKCKSHRLNHELNVVLKGDRQQTILDIDGLILENKYQSEKIVNLENEIQLARQSASRYKSMLDTNRKKGIIKLGTNNNQTIMSHSQVKNLLENGTTNELPPKAATISDLKSLCLALLDNVNDKTLALSHQKKTNKLLATKISDLEQRIKALSGDNPSLSSLSPSQILLNGYNSATVDQDLNDVAEALNQSKQNRIAKGEDAANEPANSGASQDIPTEPPSSESNKSLLSSSDDGRCVDDTSVASTTNTEDMKDAIAQLVLSVEKDLKDDEPLPPLPPEIAALVEKFKQSATT